MEMCEHRVHCQSFRDLHLRSARPLLEGHAGEFECLSYIRVGINVIYSVMPERVPLGRSCCSVVYSGWLKQQALFSEGYTLFGCVAPSLLASLARPKLARAHWQSSFGKHYVALLRSCWPVVALALRSSATAVPHVVWPCCPKITS